MIFLRLFIGLVMAGSPGLAWAQLGSDPTGEYRGIKCLKPGPLCTSAGPSDRVTIGPVRDGKAQIDVSLQFDAGQTCELSGEAIAHSKLLTLEADGLDTDQPCKLTINVDKSEIRLEDAEGACRNVYCGTRGQFDGIHLKILEKSRK